MVLPHERLRLRGTLREPAHPFLEPSQLVLDAGFPIESFLDLMMQRAAGKGNAGLGHVGNARVLLPHHGSGVRRGETRHDTHEGGLAASVGAHQRHPRALGDSKVHAVKEASLSEEHGDAGKADEGHGSYLVWLKKITTGDIPGWVTARFETLSASSEVKRIPPEAAL